MVLGDYFCADCGTTNPSNHRVSCPKYDDIIERLYRARHAGLNEDFCSHCGKNLKEGKPYKVHDGKKYHKVCYKYRRIKGE